MVPIIRGVAFEARPGRELFADLSSNVQIKILGPAKWAAWKDGKVTLDEHPLTGIVGRRHDPVWGSMRYERSLREILGSGAVKGFKKSFTLLDDVTEVFSTRPLDLSSRYNNDALRASTVILSNTRKRHIRNEHPEDIAWLLRNKASVLKAIYTPEFVDMVPRVIRKNMLTVAHVIPIQDKDYDFLSVVLAFHKENDLAQIWTTFRVRSEYLSWEDGELKPRWRRPK